MGKKKTNTSANAQGIGDKSGVDYRCSVRVDLLDVARAMTYVRGRTVPVERNGTRKTRKRFREMNVSDFYAAVGREALKGIVPDAQAKIWMAEQMVANEERVRKHLADIAAGKYRKPEGEKQKPGRKAGKVYPKWESAMQVLAEERRAITASGKSWRRKKNARKHDDATEGGGTN